jgi:methyl-accepting chemotaxis protein
MMRFSDISLVYKVGFPSAFALVMLASVAIMSLWSGQSQTNVLHRVIADSRLESRLAADSERITAANGALYVLMTKQAAGGTPAASQAALNEVVAQIDEVNADLATLRPLLPADQRAGFDAVLKDLANYRGGITLVGSMLQIDFNSAASFIAPFQTNYARMTSRLGSISRDVAAISSASAAASASEARFISHMLLAFVLGTLVVVAAVSGFITLAVRRTVTAISGATEHLASGQNDIDLSKLARRDEFGAIVRSLDVFRENQTRMNALRTEQEAMKARQEAQQAELQTQREIKQQEQRHVVDGLAAGLSKLAAGDVVFRLEAKFADEYEQLRGDFNAAMDRLQDTMRAIARNTDGVRSGAEEIMQASDDLARRTEQQAANLEQTTAALGEITSTVHKTAQGAHEARSIVESAKQNAEQSGTLMKVTVSAISDIEASSKQIANIVGVIDEIAFQTNLLALNAGVEAARAGDAGRGFAVVATEVRALAQRSAEAAKEIKGLISTSNTQVGNGVKSVAETSAALARIVEQVTNINRLVGDIAASAEAQATGLNEVNSAVGQMDQVTQKNAAMVEEATAASHALAGEAVELARLVGMFQIGEAQTAAEKPAARAAHPAPARPRVVSSARASAVSGKFHAGAVAAQAGAEDWNEF